MFRLPPLEVLRKDLDRFLGIYEQRPIRRNSGGMRLNHSFATWWLLQNLAPSFVIESGVWRGHSTWLIEQACPAATIFCLDRDLSQLEYRSTSATYSTLDFSQHAWRDLDRASSICLFDDHQNAYARLKDLVWAGFTRAIFDDNFPVAEGDCYSLRQVLAACGHPRIQMSAGFLGDDRARHSRLELEQILQSVGPRQQIIAPANSEDRDLLSRNLESYVEFPPVALNRIAPYWNVSYEGGYATETPLFAGSTLPPMLRAILTEDPEELEYCYLAFVELRRSGGIGSPSAGALMAEEQK